MVNKPDNGGDHFEQLRPPIIRSAGSTESERYLAKLADRSFLNLWLYPNLYRSQKLGGVGDGKEVCDLLVVCDAHVLIFSEKDITSTLSPNSGGRAVDQRVPRPHLPRKDHCVALR